MNFFSVNNPRRKHHPNTEGKCFLFWDGADGFRKWIPEQDGVWKLANGDLVRLVDSKDGTTETYLAHQSVLQDSTAVDQTSLSIERDLEDWLSQNLAMLEPGLALYRDGDIDGRQFDTAEVGIIDLLAVDNNGDFVVIELKAGKASDGVCGQILGYSRDTSPPS